MLINLITCCIRPENLDVIKRSILRTSIILPVCWYIIIDNRQMHWSEDQAKALETQLADPRISIKVLVFEGELLESPINLALNAISDGLLYLLDDDNLLHPEFLPEMELLLAKQPSVAAIFHQDLGKSLKSSNRHTRIAGLHTIRPGRIDSGQFAVTRDIIGAERWPNVSIHSDYYIKLTKQRIYTVVSPHQPDGNFIQNLHQKYPKKFTLIPKILSYYNRLTWKPELI